MAGKYRLYVSVSVLVALVSILFSGIVSADDKPNDDPSSAETITAGTYTGSVNEIEGDGGDWYRIDNIDNRTVKVSVKIMDYQDTEYVTVNSYGAWAITPDGQIDIFVGDDPSHDSHNWDDEDGMGTMFLSVTGNGQYELKIEFVDEDEEEENDEGSEDGITDVVSPSCFIYMLGFIGFLMFGFAG